MKSFSVVFAFSYFLAGEGSDMESGHYVIFSKLKVKMKLTGTHLGLPNAVFIELKSFVKLEFPSLIVSVEARKLIVSLIGFVLLTMISG